jgi:hypothetical protein
MGAQPSSLKRSFDLPVVSEPHKRRKTNTGSALARNTDLSLASRSSVDSGSNSGASSGCPLTCDYDLIS